MSKTREEIDTELLWFEALLDSLADGKLDEAIAGIEAAVAMLRRQRKETNA